MDHNCGRTGSRVALSVIRRDCPLPLSESTHTLSIEGPPRRLVFDAFTSATHLAQWCGPTGGKITTHAVDFKPGGVWDATIQGPDGSAYANHFVWMEIVPPERIVWLYGSSKDDPHAVPTTVTLVERGATTEVRLRILFGIKEERDEKVAKY
ncbi:MAG TPA: SRPBCC domain-containing protein [Candidatus Dormibacteraeota bacterium]|nr:SRPBCC domain-containing protein [Candidatus Dormibacteraeota bacterium]